VIQTDFETVQSKVSIPHTHTHKKHLEEVIERYCVLLKSEEWSKPRTSPTSIIITDHIKIMKLLPASKSGQSLIKFISQEQIQCLHAVLKSHWQVRSLRP